MFALIEEEHSEPLAAEITSVLLNMSEGEILHMLRSRDALDAQVRHDITRQPRIIPGCSSWTTFGGQVC